MDITQTEVKLSNGNRFFIFHNIPTIEEAIEIWLKKTKRFDAKSFVEFIRSKGSVYTALTENEFNKKYNIKN